MTTEEIAAEIKRIENEEPNKTAKKCYDEIARLYMSSPKDFGDAVLEMVSTGNLEDRKLGLEVARANKLRLPDSVIERHLNNDSTLERTCFYLFGLGLKSFIPKLNAILLDPHRKRKAPPMQALLNFGDKSSRDALDAVYDDLIEGNPSRRGKYEALQAKWSISELPQNIYPLPEKTIGIYLEKGGLGTAFPTSNIDVPTCDCCQQPMLCLFRLPKEADPTEMPIYHCPRCVFDSELYLDLASSPPQWLDKCYGEQLESDEVPTELGGSIVWGVDIKGAKKSKTFMGGKAKWAQFKEKFYCPKCEKKMKFVLQMESDYSSSTGLDFFHGGIMYVHRCRECQVACYSFQTS